MQQEGRKAAAAAGARLRRDRGAARAEHPDQRHPARRCEVAARGYVRGVTPITPQAAAALGGPRARGPGAVLPAGGGRDGDLPGRGGGPAPRLRRLAPAARAAERSSTTPGCRAIALKMATGSGKTVVMAMLIAWQTINKVYRRATPDSPSGSWWSRPGITIRDRLRRAAARGGENYYDQRDLVPPDLKGGLRAAQIVITNYHAFQLEGREGDPGRRARTPKLLLKGDRQGATRSRRRRRHGDPRPARPRDADKRRDRGAQRRGPPLLPGQAARASRRGGGQGGPRQRNEDARVWFKGLQAVQRKVGVKAGLRPVGHAVLPGGSGYNEGYIFPWVVSDFSLMDAIESGIVKVPRTPVDDDADRRAGHLPAAVGLRRRRSCPKRAAKESTGRRTGCRRRARRRAAQPATAATRRRSALGAELAPLRRAAAGVHRRLPQHRRVASWSTTGSPASEVERRRRDRRAQARQAARCSATWSTASRWRGRGRSWSTPPSSSPARRMRADFKKAAAAEIEAFKPSSAGATPVPTSTRSPTRTCCARS